MSAYRSSAVGPDGLRHVSVRPDREDIVAEVVFAERWRALMDTPSRCCQYGDGLLGDILGPLLGEPTQRDATVAATLAQWLGTNAGDAFLDLAGRLDVPRGRGVSPHHMAWAATNLRVSYVNGARRALESMLLGDGAVPGTDEVSLRDYELAECFACWLDSDEGRRFLEGCRAEIAIRRDAARHYRRPVPSFA